MADFENSDFITDYQELLDLVKTLTNKWDPSISSEADPGVVLLKLGALLKDKMSYKQDMAESQAYLDTVTDRQTAFDLLQMLGYILKGEKSSEGILSLSYTNPSNSNETVKLPAFSSFSTSNGSLTFFTKRDVTNLGNSVIDVPVIEGAPYDVEKSGIDLYSIKDIDESGRFFLQTSGVARNGVFIGIPVSNGYDYNTWVNLSAGQIYPSGKYFFVLTDSSGENYIQFPKNFESLIGDSNFKVKITKSAGAGGNVPAGSITKINVENASYYGVKQLSDTYGGEDEETIKSGIDNYYSGLGTFSTLVSSSDFEYAVKNTVNLDYIADISDAPLQFSNAFVRTAIDNQTQIISKYKDSEYIYYSLPTEDSSRGNLIEVTGLKYSSDYDESFKLANIGPDDTSKIIEQLQARTTLGSTVIVPENNYYIKATTQLSGTIFANITTKLEAQNLLLAIIDQLKYKYNAEKLHFGKKLDYQTLVSDIKNVDKRIVTVALNDPSYQVSKQSNISSDLTDGDKNKIAASLALSGKVPLYKFYNKSNIAEIENLNEGYVNAGFAMTDYSAVKDTVTNELLQLNPTIQITDNGYNRLVEPGEAFSKNLSKNQLLQFIKPKLTVNKQFGYGVQYYFYSPLNDKTILSANDQLLKQSLIKKGSIIIVASNSVGGITDTSISNVENVTIGGNSYKKCTLNKDYYVTEGVSVAYSGTDPNVSYLASGSAPAQGSTIGQVIYSKIINDLEEYTLSGSERFYCWTSDKSTDIMYSAGTVLKLSGLSIASGTSINRPESGLSLSGAQQIEELLPAIADLDESIYYFLVLNGRDELIISTDEIILEDGEFLVYSNKNLSEYIIMGAGTGLKVGSDSQEPFKLTNVRTVEDVTKPNISAFEKIPSPIKVSSNEITTYSNGYRIGQVNNNLPISDVGFSFKAIPEDITITMFKDGGTSITEAGSFSGKDGYKVRMVILIQSDENGSVYFTAPLIDINLAVDLEATIKFNDTNEIILVSNNPNASFFKYSCLLSDRLFSLLITDSNKKKIFSGNTTAKFAYCNWQTILENKANYSVIPRSIVYRFADNDEGKSITINVANPKINYSNVSGAPDIGMIALMRVKFTSNNSAASCSFSSNGTLKLKDLKNGDLTTLSSTDFNSYLFINLKSNSDLQITFTGTNVANSSSNIEFYDMSIITGYSNEIRNFENLSDAAKDYYNPTFSSTFMTDEALLNGDIEKVIKSLAGSNLLKFDQMFTPIEGIVHPTNSNEYFNSDHPLNYMTLPYIDLEPTSVEKTLRILPISGRFVK